MGIIGERDNMWSRGTVGKTCVPRGMAFRGRVHPMEPPISLLIGKEVTILDENELDLDHDAACSQVGSMLVSDGNCGPDLRERA